MRIRILSTVLIAGTLAACGESGTGPGQNDDITRADAIALARALAGTGAKVAQVGAASASTNGSGDVSAAGGGSFTFAVDATEPCQPSGTVDLDGALSGSWDQGAQTAQLDADIAVRHNACTVRADDGGIITLTGDPDIDLTLAARAGATGLTQLRITEVGAFNWAKGAGSSGRCTVDLTAELIAGTRNVHLSGSFCGFAIDETGPLED
ncbi:MAG TPA: hypothetical protein VFR81_23405 [Longimicrobium sp.]|nr:hypothetical protein [Longimicrobium sp.]